MTIFASILSLSLGEVPLAQSGILSPIIERYTAFSRNRDGLGRSHAAVVIAKVPVVSPTATVSDAGTRATAALLDVKLTTAPRSVFCH